MIGLRCWFTGAVAMTATELSRRPSVELASDHPGFSDPAYRARRGAICGRRRGPPARRPDPGRGLRAGGGRALDAGVRRAGGQARALRGAGLPGGHRPARACPATGCRSCGRSAPDCSGLTGFTVTPVPGLVPTRVFYGSLADRTFCSTQYIRHHSVPFYTPEPDVVHELVGHCNMLADPDFAELYQLAGQASRRAESDAALDFFSRVFWFTFEFGVAWEQRELRTYGAGILSSFGELDAFRSAEIRPFDLGPWGPRATTSPGTSRCCSPAGRSPTWWTSSAASCAPTTTTPTSASCAPPPADARPALSPVHRGDPP